MPSKNEFCDGGLNLGQKTNHQRKFITDSYDKSPVLSITFQTDIKRTGLPVSQVADEVRYTGLIEMQEIVVPDG